MTPSRTCDSPEAHATRPVDDRESNRLAAALLGLAAAIATCTRCEAQTFAPVTTPSSAAFLVGVVWGPGHFFNRETR